MKEDALRLSHARVMIARSGLPAPVISYDVAARRWRLEADYGYFDDPNRITVPSQFSFNLASVPRAFWWLIAPFELSIAAPLIHDFLYRHRGNPPAGAIAPPRSYSRKQTDLLFRKVMAQEGVPAWRRVAAYHAVRWFGGGTWGQVRLRLMTTAPVLALLACVTQEHREVSATRTEYMRCVAQHAEAHPDCVALRDRLDSAERRYQENSRRAWSCDPAQESCPTPR